MIWPTNDEFKIALIILAVLLTMPIWVPAILILIGLF